MRVCVECMAYNKRLMPLPLPLVQCDRRRGACLTVSGKNHTFVFHFWPHCVALEILVLQSGIEPKPPALEAQSLNHRGLPGKSPKFTFVNSRHPTIFFLRLCHFAGVFKNLLRLFCLVQGGDRPTQFQSSVIAGLPQARTTLN